MVSLLVELLLQDAQRAGTIQHRRMHLQLSEEEQDCL
jgi:hypothetical protein